MFSDRQVWANSVDQDQTAPGWSGSTLFAIWSALSGHITLYCLNFRVITAKISGVQIFRTFTVPQSQYLPVIFSCTGWLCHSTPGSVSSPCNLSVLSYPRILSHSMDQQLKGMKWNIFKLSQRHLSNIATNSQQTEVKVFYRLFFVQSFYRLFFCTILEQSW